MNYNEATIYNKAEVNICNDVKITLGNIPNNTVGINKLNNI